MRDSPLNFVLRELDALGIAYTLDEGKHVKVRFCWAGHRMTYTCTRNPNPGKRAQENSRAGIRRLLKQCGALDPGGTRG